MKKFTKLLSAMLAVMMLVSSIGMVAFAETADVAIKFSNLSMENNSATGGLTITNVVNTASGREDVEGWAMGNTITFNFDTEMDTTTLTPENIKITLETKSATSGKVLNLNSYNTAKTTIVENDTTDVANLYTYYWSYEPCEVTSTSYSINIADMCEGTMQHKVTFTEGVKTAAGASINPVSKYFKTGRIAPVAPVANKRIKDVSYGKTLTSSGITDPNSVGVAKLLQHRSRYDGSDLYWGGSGWIKIDLGNYYDISDIMLVGGWDCPQNTKLTAYYSNDPDATIDEATEWKEFPSEQFWLNSSNVVSGEAVGGRGYTRWLKPENSVRARYIFIKNTGTVTDRINTVRVFSYVDTDYGVMTATKDGAEVTTCTGAGDYTFTVAAKQHQAGTAGGYMIVAGYDSTGAIKAIKCDPVEYADSALTMTATMPDGTVSIKASLIKDFTSPYLLTDALELPAAQ